MAGANAGDFLANILHLGHLRGLPPLAAAFVVIVWAERRAQATTEAYYWLAIIVLRTGATNLPRLLAPDLQLCHGLIDTGPTAPLIPLLLADRPRRRAT